MDKNRHSAAGLTSQPNAIEKHLEKLGFIRKGVDHDASSLFRAVSEEVYGTQYHHELVRRRCALSMELYTEFYVITELLRPCRQSAQAHDGWFFDIIMLIFFQF